MLWGGVAVVSTVGLLGSEGRGEGREEEREGTEGREGGNTHRKPIRGLILWDGYTRARALAERGGGDGHAEVAASEDCHDKFQAGEYRIHVGE